MRVLQSSSTPHSPLACEWLSLTPRRPTALMPFQSEWTAQTDGMRVRELNSITCIKDNKGTLPHRVLSSHRSSKSQYCIKQVYQDKNTQAQKKELSSGSIFLWVTQGRKMFSVAPSAAQLINLLFHFIFFVCLQLLNQSLNFFFAFSYPCVSLFSYSKALTRYPK